MGYLSARHQLHYEENLFAVLLFDDLVKLNDVGVVDLREDVDLVLQRDEVVLVHALPVAKLAPYQLAYLLIILIATFSPVFLFVPFFTTAKLPLSEVSAQTYLPISPSIL